MPSRRAVLVLVFLGACDAGLSGGSGASSGGSGCGGDDGGSTSATAYTGCDYGSVPLSYSGCSGGPGFTAGGGFTYACPAVPDGGTWFAADDAGGAPLLPTETDPYCAFLAQAVPVASAFEVLYGLPNVAVGESFLLDYDTDAGGPVTIAPATPSEIQTTPGGVAITQPGYLAFIAWQGSAVAGFTNLLARNATGLALSTSFPVATDGAAPSPITLDGGSLASLVAFPTADDGTLLAGVSPACTFVSSAPEIVSVQARGVVAVLTLAGGGEATVSARCGALSGAVTLQVAGAVPVDDAQVDEAGDDARVNGGLDGATDGAVEATVDALDEEGQP